LVLPVVFPAQPQIAHFVERVVNWTEVAGKRVHALSDSRGPYNGLVNRFAACGHRSKHV
jgi:hypothetical protein